MLVSIIIPYYKKKNFINKTINSILNQTYKKFEIILINDEKGRESKKILSNLKKRDKRIRIIYNKKNIGAGLSRNKGIKNSKGKYIAFIDSDDLWTKNKLKLQIEFMKKFNFNISHTAYHIIDCNNDRIASRRSRILNHEILKNSCDVGLSTVMIKKKFLQNKKLFSKYKTKEDFFFWLNLTKGGEIFYYLDKPLTYWRKTKDSLSSSTIQKLLDSYKVYFYYEKSIIVSIIKTLVLSFNFMKKKLNDY